MKIVPKLSEYHQKENLALSMGMFDGVHLGHRSIIEKLKKVAAEKNLKTGLLTFWPHPRTVFNPQEKLKLLSLLQEKLELIEKLDVDFVFLQEFDENFRNLSGEDFIRNILHDKLNVMHLIIGHDHSFGKNKSGNYELLLEKSQTFNYDVQQVEAILHENRNISSTQIRNALSSGDITTANTMLGYDYFLSGTVIHGKKIGRTIGFPTANINVNEMKLLPKKGAYIVEVLLNNKILKGMLSIGTNPTVHGDQLSVEVHILDFNENIYGENILVAFKAFLHEEIKFSSLDELIVKLKEDQMKTQNYFLDTSAENNRFSRNS